MTAVGVLDFVHVVELVRDALRHRQPLGLLRECAAPADKVDRAMLGGCGQPATRVGWDAVAGPAIRRDCERVRGGFLGEVEIAEEPHQRGQHAAPLIAEDLLEQG